MLREEVLVYLEKHALYLRRMVSTIHCRSKFSYVEDYIAIIKVKCMMTNWVVARPNDLIEAGHDGSCGTGRRTGRICVINREP